MPDHTLPNHISERIEILKSQTLIDLLVDQCSDLESLLTLARRETTAAESGDFDSVLDVARERASLGERLEVYSRQISELRNKLGQDNHHLSEHTLAKQAVQLLLNIRSQDNETTSLLLAARTRIGESIAQLDQRHRNSIAYLQNGIASGLNCDRLA